MKSNKNTNKPETDYSWLAHKWLLILSAMFYCYLCLHVSPGLESTEIALCVIITLSFASVIKYNQEAKRVKKSSIIPAYFSALAVAGRVLRFIIYPILFISILLFFMMIYFLLSLP